MPAQPGRRRQASRKAVKPSAAAGTSSKLSTASDAAIVPAANVTSVAPPHPGAIPSATRPSRSAQASRAAPPVASRTAQSRRSPAWCHCGGGRSRTISAAGKARNDTPGALSE